MMRHDSSHDEKAGTAHGSRSPGGDSWMRRLVAWDRSFTPWCSQGRARRWVAGVAIALAVASAISMGGFVLLGERHESARAQEWEEAFERTHPTSEQRVAHSAERIARIDMETDRVMPVLTWLERGVWAFGGVAVVLHFPVRRERSSRGEVTPAP